jgi:hypothetical protein
MLAFLRFVAGVLLLVAVIAFVQDGTRAMIEGSIVTTTVGEHWAKLLPATFKAAQASIQRNTHPLLWTVFAGSVLRLPTSIAFLLLGALFAYAGRRRKRVNVFAN